MPALVLLLAASLAWIGTVVWIRGEHMGAAPGTMGMAPVTFVAMWALMMAAMMLPSVWPRAAPAGSPAWLPATPAPGPLRA
jgi:hypothetical protein